MDDTLRQRLDLEEPPGRDQDRQPDRPRRTGDGASGVGLLDDRAGAAGRERTGLPRDQDDPGPHPDPRRTRRSRAGSSPRSRIRPTSRRHALAGRGQAVLLDRRETVAKLLVQAARQAGISVAVQELLDFDGHEIYMEESRRISHGKTFGAALLALRGLRRDRAARLRTNGSRSTRLRSGSSLPVTG